MAQGLLTVEQRRALLFEGVNRVPKFPFKARSQKERASVNARISKLLMGINDMLIGIARDKCPKDFDSNDLDDVVQKTMIHLWQVSLPKYNAWRKPFCKPSTFLFRCAYNYVSQEMRVISRARKTHMLCTGFADLELRQDRDRLLDVRIAALAEEVIRNPERFLTPSQSMVFSTLLDNEGKMMKYLAEILKYRRASSLSMMLRRIKERIAGIDIEDWDATDPVELGQTS